MLRTSAVPVLSSAGAHDAPPRRILVALDEDDVSPWVIRWAQELRRRFDAQVRAVHVLTSVAGAAAVGGGLELPLPPDPELLAEAAAGSAAHWRHQLRGEGFTDAQVTVDALYGSAAGTIVDLAAADLTELIVMGNRRSGRRAPRTMLGSTVRAVLREAKCPVLVVSPPTDEIVDDTSEAGA